MEEEKGTAAVRLKRFDPDWSGVPISPSKSHSPRVPPALPMEEGPAMQMFFFGELISSSELT